MISDKLNQFCDGVALNTGGANSYLLGDQIDLQVPADLGHVEGAYLVIKARTQITAATNGTLSFVLASDDAAAINVSTGSRHLTTPARAVGAGIPAGTILFAGQLPYEGSTPYERFLGILQVTGVAAMTAGSIDAFLVKDLAAWKAYEAVV
jgi:hypothetical protein